MRHAAEQAGDGRAAAPQPPPPPAKPPGRTRALLRGGLATAAAGAQVQAKLHALHRVRRRLLARCGGQAAGGRWRTGGERVLEAVG